MDRPGSRYVPRGIGGGDWLAFDKLTGEFVPQDDIGKINADEMLTN